MKSMILAAAGFALVLSTSAAFADATTNVCKPDLNNPDTSNTVMCTWPNDPASFPVPDISDCQAKIRTPTSTGDDCGNSDFNNCMQNKGFECSTTQS